MDQIVIIVYLVVTIVLGYKVILNAYVSKDFMIILVSKFALVNFFFLNIFIN